MLRRTNYGLWVDDKGYNSETENAIEYIVNCAKDNGIEVIEGQTALSIPFIAKIMKAMNENKRPKGEWVLREEQFDDEKEPRKVWGCKLCGFSLKSVHDKRNYCPNCGKKMLSTDSESEE